MTLTIDAVSARYGNAHVIRRLSDTWRNGEVTALIGSKGEGFLMRVVAERCSLARPRRALENLPRWKPRWSWIRLWGKCADGRGDGCIRSAADGVPGA